MYCGKDTTTQDMDLIDKLFSYIGISQSVPESLMNAVGALSGCGPAFVSYCKVKINRQNRNYIINYIY